MRSIREAPKRPINLSLNAKVLDMAKDMGLNISQTVDALLTEEVLRQYRERWQEDNAQAIADYNARIEREGTFSQRIQRYLEEQRAKEPESSR
ncbi:type II toxin-antitoxin system CcdA family antitoxin [Aquincola sp. S2]|uniref:Type II toxin-antitoxin system CcdA family antitoxin n=1 Tax=Pseudaquabacterium terrae TaxID=2732868 RepID=A0ABX2EI99_9BURK|nr:type II toxin-antitoxin system CcdA family antitoxin [Aquabacterium terrae]NRF68372.1 type II toxin-antitoxin system CcdA family antitoxin [Aquabacterium terrae]